MPFNVDQEKAPDVKEDEELQESNPSEATEPEVPEGKKSKKFKVMIIVIMLVLIGLAAAGGIYYKKTHGEHSEESSEEEEGQNVPIFVPVEEFIINLNTGNKGVSFLKLKISIQVSDVKSQTKIEEMMPKIRDTMQLYLRELRPADMQGSMSLYRLREEVILRLNKLLYPQYVDDILFDEILVQ